MKKLILFLTLLFVGISANAQYTPSNSLNYIKLLKVPPVGSVEDSVLVFDGSDSFVKMRPSSELITKATPTKSGVVKTNALEADPVVYTKTSVDNALKLKSYLSTGLLKNGLVQTNADPTKFNITSGIGIISNFDDPENPTSVVVNFPAFTGITPAYLTTSNITYIAINSTPSVVMQASPFTSEQRRDLIILGAAIHSDLTTINLVNNISAPTNAETNQLHDLMEVIGALNVSGNKYSANGVNLSLNKSAGEIFKLGVNFANDWKHPHDLDIAGQTLLSFRYRTQNGTEGSDVTVLNPAVYDLANVLTAVPSNRFTIQTVTLFQTGQTRIQYGQNTYATLSEAEAAILTRSYIAESNIATNGITRAYIIVRNNATDLTNATTSKIIEAQKFGGVTSGGVALTYANIVAALGYTPENAANKATDFTVINDVKYPSTQAVKNELKTNSITNNSSVIGVTTTDALNNLDAAMVHKTGSLSESITGAKTITNSTYVRTNYFDFINNFNSGSNNRTVDNSPLSIQNNFGGIGFHFDNQSTGWGGYGFNQSSGVLIGLDATTSSTGDLLRFSKNEVTTAGIKHDGSLYTTFGKFGTSANVTAPQITVTNGSNPSVIEFPKTGFTMVGTVGALGSYEMNMSTNMDYTTSPGTHRFYDNTKDATWLAIGDSFWQMQYAPASVAAGDVWNIAGQPRPLYQRTDTGLMRVNTTVALSGVGTIGDAMFAVRRSAGFASIAGENDLSLEGAKTKGVAATIYLNTYSTGNVSLVAGGGKVIVGTTPATSSGTYDVLTRNTSTGEVEKAASSALKNYKTYTALLSQTGTNAPTAIVLENTLGGTVVWTRSLIGNYVGTLSGAFTTNKTAVLHGNGTTNTIVSSIVSSVNSVGIVTTTAGAGADGLLSNTTLEIRVYP